MKIAVIGSQCTGKSTYIEDFIKKWPMYEVCPHQRYSDLIKEKSLSVNEEGNEESQRIILESLVDQALNTPKDSNTLFDRSVLDNLVYTMWLNSKNKVSDTFVKETIKLVRETLIFYDVLFFLPISKMSPVPFEEDLNRSVSEHFRAEIDAIFKALLKQWHKENKTYFPFDHDLGCPAIIEIFGDREQRTALTEMYINPEGQPFTEEESLIHVPGETDKDQPTLLDFQ